MDDQRRKRLKALVRALQDETTVREFADRLGVPLGTLSTWKKGIGVKSKLAIVRYVSVHFGKRELEDLDAYLDGNLSLHDFLDPQYKLQETLARFNLATVRAWMKNRANLSDKLILLEDLVAQIGGIAKANSALRLAQALQTLLDSDDPRFTDLNAIAQIVGIDAKRLDSLYRGEGMPCEDEILALSPYLTEDIAELRRVYVTGESERARQS